MFSFSEILVNFDKNGKKIAKNYTVSTQCTNCNSEISPPIPPRTKRHSVLYQLDSPPLLGKINRMKLIIKISSAVSPCNNLKCVAYLDKLFHSILYIR